MAQVLSPALSKFLKSRTTRSSDDYTFATIEPPLKYMVDWKDLNEFYKLYTESVKIHGPHTFLENVKHTASVPWVLDLDFRGTTNQPLYTMDDVHILLQLCTKIFTTRFQDVPTDERMAVVFTKPHKYDDETGVCKHGIHIHFPYVFVNKEQITMGIIEYYRQVVFEELNRNAMFLNRISDRLNVKSIIDDVSKKNWLLYRSAKSSSSIPYTIHSCYIIDKSVRQIELYDACKDYIYDDQQEVFVKVNRDDFTDLHLTKLLSIRHRCPRFRRTIIPHALDATFDMIRVVSEDDDDTYSDTSDDDVHISELTTSRDVNQNVVTTALRVLTADIESNPTWFKVGCLLHCISNGSDEGFSQWVDWTTRKSNWNKVTKYTRDDMNRRWMSMDKRMDVQTAFKRLVGMAYKLDSVSMSAILKETPDDDMLRKCSYDCQDMTIIEYIDKLYREDYVSCSKKTDHYYRYQIQTGLWIEPRSKMDKMLSIEIGTVVADNFKRYRSKLEEERKHIDQEQKDEVQQIDSRIKNLTRCIQTVRRAGKSSLLLELRHWFYNRDFLQNLDQNPHLFAFKNGVYDTRSCALREANRNDYLSIQSPVRLSKPTASEHKDLEDYFTKIFPNPIIREYFLDVYAHIFHGGNRFKQIYFWSGAQGNNGKTVTQKLFTAMLGEYSKEVPVTLFTHRHGSSSAASPEQARVVKCRMVTANEPEASDSLNIGFLKARSGNDRYYVRTLYSEGFEADPMFKLNIICNSPPRAEGADNAFWNRVIVFPFVSTFDTKAPESIEEQMATNHYPADVCIEDKLPVMAQTLAWELTTRLERNGFNPIPVPDVIREQISIYQQSNNNYIVFVHEFIEKSSNPHDKFRYEDALVKFKRWLSPRATERRSTNMKEMFKQALIDYCGNPDEYVQWFGWMLLSDK